MVTARATPLVCGLYLALTPAAAYAQDSDFAEISNVPDYSVTMEEVSVEGSDVSTVHIRHRAGWVRSDRRGSSLFVNPKNGIEVQVLNSKRQLDPYATYITYTLPEARNMVVAPYIRTDETETIAGETCDRWQNRMSYALADESWTNCVTRDGVELAVKDSARTRKATSVERKKIDSSEVEPPISLLDIRDKLAVEPTHGPDKDRPADFVVTFKTTDGRSTLRRHYPWFSWQTRLNDGTLKFTVWNEQTRQEADFEIIPKRKSELKYVKGFTAAGSNRIGPYISPLGVPEGGVDLGRKEQVAGISCSWLDKAPEEKYRWRKLCVSEAGDPLKIETSSNGGEPDIFVAENVEMRDVGVEEIKPPAELLRAADWGFTN